jgi:16S rRNA (cytosine1402-N4)-methyltransferase
MMAASDAAAVHDPVLLNEAMEFLAPVAGGIYCDATVGMGGHAAAILERSSPDGRLLGIDRDPAALALATARLARYGDRVRLVHARFGALRAVLESSSTTSVDGILVDLGVSSLHLDRAERGFSFRQEGPLDMRMDQSQGETAADFLCRTDAAELESVLRDLGEERYARRIASAIMAARERGALSTTSALAALVAQVVPSRERSRDPATRTFQALRIAINDELGELERLLADAPGYLRPGGRLVVISFHSLEDRMAKRCLRAMSSQPQPRLRLLNKHVVVAGEQERRRNPRARSAKLRAAERVPA